MKSKLLYERDGLRTFAVVFDSGDEVVEGLLRFARERGVTGASLTAIGALSDVTWGFFDIGLKQYVATPLGEQVEVVSIVGNIGVVDDQPKLHAHIVVARADGSAHGGHLIEAHVRPTLEVVVTETPVALRRRTDEATGLPLIDLSA